MGGVGALGIIHDPNEDPCPPELQPQTATPARWIWEWHVLWAGPTTAMPLGLATMAVDPQGKILPLSPSLHGGFLKMAVYRQPGTDPTDPFAGRPIQAMLGPVFMALAFLHCKNVTITAPVREQKYDRAARRRGDPEGLTYHRLVIEPMQRVLHQAAADAGAPHDLQRALHICRGHFKDYREGAGLFGKQRGLFWWEAQVRGTAAAGRVVKDYDVRPPEAP
jgi:hypothetical protein